MALTDNLISFWELGEASGTRNDSHGTNHLTDNNTVTQTTGKVGNCGQFTLANSEYLSRADNSSLSLGSTVSWTFCAWVYADSLPTYMMIASQVASGSSECSWQLYYDPGGPGFALGISSAGTSIDNAVSLNMSVSTATWYFIVGWYDYAATTLGLQANNGTPATATIATGAVDSSSDFRIGTRHNTPELFWNGRIDQVGFWKRALNSTERGTLYNSGNGVSYADISGGGGGSFKSAWARGSNQVLGV